MASHLPPDSHREREASPSATARLDSALALYRQGQLARAENGCREILAQAPHAFEALHLLGLIELRKSNHAAAAEVLSAAIAVKPGDADARFHYAIALQHLGRHSDALASYDLVLEHAGGHAETLNNRGVTLYELERHEEALASYDRALLSKPDYAAAAFNRGNVLHALKRHLEALASYDLAILLKPDYVKAFINRGSVLQDLNRCEDALASYERALALQPQSAEALNNRGNVLREFGEFDEALACYRQSLSADPGRPQVHDALIFTLLRTSPDGDAARAQCEAFARRFEQRERWLSHANSRAPERRLKVGYVSGDFRGHSVAALMAPILANHDREAVEVYCYSNSPSSDEVSEKLMRYAHHWRSVVQLSDDDLAALVQQDRIDVLVDLSGHTLHNRLLAFARKPAPVQVTWIGLPFTTGLQAMDYRLTNHYIDPVGTTERFHTEKLMRLSTTACFEPMAALPPVSELPARSNGYVTFASFNEFTKITPEVYSLWATILTKRPDSRLMMVCPRHSRPHAQRTLLARGVTPERLIFVDKVSLPDYLELHNSVDIALDTFPYNGGTTTRNSLWMGVPVVSLAGATPVSRFGLALMSQVGLEAFVGTTGEAYVQIALRWAADFDGLAKVRSTLRETVRAASFSDAAACTRELETAYRCMWRTWCAESA